MALRKKTLPPKYPRCHLIEITVTAKGPRLARRTTPKVGPGDLVIWRANAPFSLSFTGNLGSPGKDKNRLRYGSDRTHEVRLHMREIAGINPSEKPFSYDIEAFDQTLDPVIIIDPGMKAIIR